MAYLDMGYLFIYATRKGHRTKKWSILCCPKYQAGLGINDLDTKKHFHVGKWLFKLLIED